MPASYLARHRPICSVIEDIREKALSQNDMKLVSLCDEALSYAKSMSNKLVEYKERMNGK